MNKPELMVEINLSPIPTVHWKDTLSEKVFIGIELQSKERYFVITVHADNEDSFAIINPETMTQHSTFVYPSKEELYRSLTKNSVKPVEKFMAFASSSELFDWAKGIEADSGLEILFESSKADPEKLPEDAVIGLRIDGRPFFLMQTGERHSFMLINAGNHTCISVHHGNLAETLREIKTRGDVEAYSFLNPEIMYDWTRNCLSNGGKYYELTSE